MKTTLRLALAQNNFLVGDLAGNSAKIIATAHRAKHEFKADLVVFPELALSGYPPEDLLLRHDFYLAVRTQLQEIATAVRDIDLVVGFPEAASGCHYNSAAFISGGKIATIYRKQCLPNQGVFDEKRYFNEGCESAIVTVKGKKIALLICEDIWCDGKVADAARLGAELLLSINASPFDIRKDHLRQSVLKKQIAATGLPIAYLNLVGGQDELVFDGGSLVFNGDGALKMQAEFFKEELMIVDFVAVDGRLMVAKEQLLVPCSEVELAYRALVLGTRDYIKKNGFPGALLGLSGGIDSALTLAIAVDAIGKENVFTYALPSRYTSQMSLDYAAKIAANFGVKHSIISIEPIFKSYLESLAAEFRGLASDLTEENLQSRCRGTLLMALSNKKGYIVLSTGNKSEMAVGYTTLYGDTVGGFCVLKDVAKTLVYRLVQYRNQLAGFDLIPQSIIERPPSAELRPDQKDSDSLPPYEILDAILELYVEKDAALNDIVAAGFAEETVKRVVAMVKKSEYKRRQVAPGPRITAHAFGRDRRYPLTAGQF